MIGRFLHSYWSIPVVILMILSVYAVVPPLLSMSESRPHRYVCRSNLKQISLGLFMNAQDYDQKFPPVLLSGRKVGWVNALYPYLKSYQIFQCPTEGNPANQKLRSDRLGFTDYWMNKNVSGIIWTGKESVSPDIIILGDGDGASPASTASYAIDKLPASWLQSSESPAKRHKGGANYAFLDGHVERLKPNQISQVPSSSNNDVYTFSTE